MLNSYLIQLHVFLSENEPQKRKTLRKCLEILQSQIPKLKFLKTLIFLRAFQKLQN